MKETLAAAVRTQHIKWCEIMNEKEFIIYCFTHIVFVHFACIYLSGHK